MNKVFVIEVNGLVENHLTLTINMHGQFLIQYNKIINKINYLFISC